MPIRGCATLRAALAALLEPEHLTGSNCLACEHCGERTEAARKLHIVTAPPLLCLSLQRFCFDYAVGFYCWWCGVW